MKLLRSDLYRLMWAHPGIHVAGLLGMSSSALTRVCKRFNVPAPSRGYWRRVEVGKSVERVPLSDGPNTELPYTVTEALAKALAALPSTATDTSASMPVGRFGTQQSPNLLSMLPEEPTADEPPMNAQGRPAPEAEQACSAIDVASGPLADDLIAMAMQHYHLTLMATFIQDVRAAASHQPPPVAALVKLWAYQAEVVMRVVAPVDRVVDACRLASWRNLPPS